MENTAIEWTDHTFNPWVGCTKVSPACDHCYAEAWALRTGAPELWQGSRRRTSVSNWKKPLKWNREAAERGIRYRVFCASLADVFDNEVPQDWRVDLWELIALTSHLTWQLLTKRVGNVAKMVPESWMLNGFPNNVWLGSTVIDQAEADRDIQKLLQVPARVRFLSMEPLLSQVDLSRDGWLELPGLARGGRGLVEASVLVDELRDDLNRRRNGEHTLDWVIVGGESGGGARPMRLEWARSLRDQCASAGVPFFFKQWGEWAPRSAAIGEPSDWEGMKMMRVGKKNAGRMLDGRIYGEFPA